MNLKLRKWKASQISRILLADTLYPTKDESTKMSTKIILIL